MNPCHECQTPISEQALACPNVERPIPPELLGMDGAMSISHLWRLLAYRFGI